MPVSHKSLPTGYNNLCINNYAIFVSIQHYLSDSIKLGYEKIKPHLTYIMSPNLQKQLMNYEHLVPYVPKSFVVNKFLEGNKGNYFSLSNFILSDRPYLISGRKVRKIRLFVSNPFEESIRCYLVTYNNKITLTSSAVEGCDFDNKKLIDLAMANFQQEIDSLPKVS